MVEWIEADKPIRFLHGRYKKPLSGLNLAVSSGIHSLVFDLLSKCEWTDSELSNALFIATERGKKYLVELLLDFDAPVDDIDPYFFCRMVDLNVLERIIDLGVDITKGDAFGRALLETGGRPLLRFYKENRDQIPGLGEQLNITLIKAIENRKLRTSVLLIWAGADPYKEVSHDFRYDYPGYSAYKPEPDEDDYTMNAFKALAFLGDLDFYDKLKLKPAPELIPVMLTFAEHNPNSDLFPHLLDECPIQLLNPGEGKSCKALEDLVSHYFMDFGYGKPYAGGHAEMIEIFLKKRARWNPPQSDLRYIRDNLCSAPDDHIMKVVDLLLRYDQAPKSKRPKVCPSS